jgi:hypothetical protein
MIAAAGSSTMPPDVIHARLLAAGLLPPELKKLDAYLEAIEMAGVANPDPSAEDMAGDRGQPGEDDPEDVAQADPPRMAANDATPRPLYVSRKLLNAGDVIAWAKAQGFETTLPAADLHVTVAFSRAPVDWMKAGESWSGDGKGNLTVQAGGPRMVEALGDKGAVVLLFASHDLDWRHRALREAGASWDWAEYQPHVTLSYRAGAVDLAAVEPYRGPLVFGPEIFEALDDDWAGKVKES